MLLLLEIFLVAASGFQIGSAGVPAATIRSPFLVVTEGNSYRRSYNFDRGAEGSSSRPSYVIYDGDVRALPNDRDRPQVLSTTRQWHLDFQKRHTQPPQQEISYQDPYSNRQQVFPYQNGYPKVQIPNRIEQPKQEVPYQAVYSNLIQIYDKPEREYYGPYDSKSYLDPERGFYSYPREIARPAQVPYYDVVYPYEQPLTQFYGDRLPDRFPATFQPSKTFELKDPPTSHFDGPRKEFGGYRTETVNYVNAGNDKDRRGSRKEMCNYIRLNEKGFPGGNELCGRSISDILLAPDYPTTGQLLLEHRKRYRGVHQGRSLGIEAGESPEKTGDKVEPEKTEEPAKNNNESIDGQAKSEDGSQEVLMENETRRKRSAYEYSAYGRGAGSCCSGGSAGTAGYGYGQYESYNPYNDDGSDFRSYRGNGRGGYGHSYGGYRYQGRYPDNYGDDGEETSNHRGLTSYMTGGSRGYRKQDSSDENGSGENENRGSSKNNSNRSSGSSQGTTQNSSKGGKSSNSSSNNRNKDQSSNRSSSDRGSESRRQRNNGSGSSNSLGDWRHGRDDEGDDYQSGYDSSANGGNSYNMRDGYRGSEGSGSYSRGNSYGGSMRDDSNGGYRRSNEYGGIYNRELGGDYNSEGGNGGYRGISGYNNYASSGYGSNYPNRGIYSSYGSTYGR